MNSNLKSSIPENNTSALEVGTNPVRAGKLLIYAKNAFL